MRNPEFGAALPQRTGTSLKRALLGEAKDLRDPSIHHKLSLVAFLAWVGLGADGLSSSAYGPEEAYKALGQHTYLALLLVLATAITVFVISFSYSKIIERFPQGGGGYLVATELLGETVGVISGCALLVDYVLTITVSIAGGGDAIFSLLPLSMHVLKRPVEFFAIVALIVLNLRGIKESITILVPIFMTFVVTHALLIGGGVISHLFELPHLTHTVTSGFQSGASEVGAFGLFLIFLRAYSIGGGTYTGIEAVSNAVGALREPKVETGKRTMLYMAISLATTAGGLLLCYMLIHAEPVEGQTLNAVLADKLA
ncbi:APC family permease [Candidatus Sumerlaeota bacterium]|nr:APC family permease [Candidatus Sumerlaeota bacterium]